MNNYDTFEPHTLHPTKQPTNEAVKSAHLWPTPHAAYQNIVHSSIGNKGYISKIYGTAYTNIANNRPWKALSNHWWLLLLLRSKIYLSGSVDVQAKQ